MKRVISLLFLFGTVSVSCVKEQQEAVVPVYADDEVFYAVLDGSGAPEIRAYANEQLRGRWDAADHISIFNKNTLNREYVFQGQTGDNSGEFKKYTGESFYAGNPLDYAYAVYPYSESTSISDEGAITLTLPAAQSYRENTYGLGANTMVAVTDEDELMFKNLCGYLAVKLYGDNLSISSISLKGNNDELLAGRATVSASMDAAPTLTFIDEAATKVITLTCPTPVMLGTTAETATTFWFVIPPTTFTGGISLTVTFDSGLVYKKTTVSSLTIQRNTLKRASALQVISGLPTPEVIDLGLSVKWASFNLGATAPEEYGDYYAWGEAAPYYMAGSAQSESPVWKDGKSAGYDWASYRWSMGSSNTLTKYCTDTSYGNNGFTDDKTVLDPEDDVAHLMLRGNWRMPTVNEEVELINNCTSEWTTVNGVYGRRFTSNLEGFTDKSIFLPNAGFRGGTTLTYLGTRGYYWSSSFNPAMPDRAHDLYFASDFVRWGTNGGPRSQGRSVRPVMDNPGFVAVTGITLDKSELTLTGGQTQTLVATVLPSTANNKTLAWTSSDESVATVDENGKVTAVAEGNAMITVTANDCSRKSATCAITVPSPVDLSASATANCYIVSQAGYYKFKTVKGNSSTSVGSVSSVEVLWESFGNATAPAIGDLVRQVSVNNGYIHFVASEKKGNAVVAAKNASGKILWSWHIWLTDKPADQTYRNSAGKMMDRNLGATTTTPGNVRALGLLYQWGRKDPFLSGQGITNKKMAASTLNTWPVVKTSEVLESHNAMNYSIAHPTTFLLNPTDPWDWYCTSDSYRNNSLWSSTKTIYDPCPAGYKVPTGGSSGIWAKAAGSATMPSWNSTSVGCDFNGVFTSSGSCWYPACGQITYGEASRSTGAGGYYWSINLSGDYPYELLLESNRVSAIMYSKYRSSGRSVRCQKVN